MYHVFNNDTTQPRQKMVHFKVIYMCLCFYAKRKFTYQRKYHQSTHQCYQLLCKDTCLNTSLSHHNSYQLGNFQQQRGVIASVVPLSQPIVLHHIDHYQVMQQLKVLDLWNEYNCIKRISEDGCLMSKFSRDFPLKPLTWK